MAFKQFRIYCSVALERDDSNIQNSWIFELCALQLICVSDYSYTVTRPGLDHPHLKSYAVQVNMNMHFVIKNLVIKHLACLIVLYIGMIL